MKKLIALALALVLCLAFVSCAKNPAEKSEGVMTYAEYMAAELDTEVVIEAYVQATQSWWSDKITVYAADPDGAYFIYELACSEADAAKLTPGTKIKVSGTKKAWAGEIEIMYPTFEFVNDGVTYTSTATDITGKIGSDDIINYQNQLVAFKGMTITAIEYKNGEPGDDIYVTVSKGETTYSFCVERYLTAPGTDVYKAFTDETVKVGDTVDIEGFLYWYEGVNTHITAITKK